MRKAAGEDIFISDGEGGRYITTVDQITKGGIVLKIKETLTKQKREERKIKITLACAIPKFTSFEDIVDKGTQLGIDEIIPLLTQRTLIKREVFERKMGQLKRVMTTAARQSGALFLPDLKDPMSFDDLLKVIHQFELCLLPNLSDKAFDLKDAVAPFKKGRLLVMIGPEGDFTRREIDLAFKAGCRGISLGESVLRVDTAAIAVMSFLRLYLE